MVGSFLVSVFSSLCFYAFFLIREGLLFLSQQVVPVWPLVEHGETNISLNMNTKSSSVNCTNAL